MPQQQQPTIPSSPPLYLHVPHPARAVRNANAVHTEEHLARSLNLRIAVVLTRFVGSMPTAYLFVLLALVGLLAILGIFPLLLVLLVAWTSQTLLQLVLLPVIMVGQNVLSQKQEIQADEQFHAVLKSEHEIAEMIHHLDAQDDELLRQTREIAAITQELFDHKAIMMQFLTRVEKFSGSGKFLESSMALVTTGGGNDLVPSSSPPAAAAASPRTSGRRKKRGEKNNVQGQDMPLKNMNYLP